MLKFQSHASSSSGNLHSIADGITTIMVDCGLPWKQIQKAFDFKTSGIAGVCCTHEHKDHSRGIRDASRAGIDVYLLPETRIALNLSGHRLHEIELLKTFTVGTFAIKAFGLQHDAPNCGFLFASGSEKAVYITDSFYCRYRFSGLNIVAIECNWRKETLSPNLEPAVKKRLIRSHFGLSNVKKFLAANDLSAVREIHLLHLGRANSDADLFQREIEKITGIATYVAKA